jgi:hypothetical protein
MWRCWAGEEIAHVPPVRKVRERRAAELRAAEVWSRSRAAGDETARVLGVGKVRDQR